ncbi:hypothetical protein Q0590_23260 [Rhodocytophaga aerolata]|uniref:Uncharacterized protein n=1 Tax=Rhodocytophaga aerolata TaxID=455078 RepID=A0ABT8REP2_9BACT|nr:hypothetical protein [Rhodocytophaga aerolata]MDO1449215.1 hypothetical protein [Rhodocytophaga aerolata]
MKNTVDIQLEFNNNTLRAKEPTTLLLIPISSEESTTPLSLEEVHTKDIHLIVVSEDLSFFTHEHQQKEGKGYTVNLTFPFAGKFFLYSDIKPLGGFPVVVQKTVVVAGEQKEAQHYQHEVLSASIEGVYVQLDVNDSSAIKVHIQRNGILIPASSLGDFLGAKAHVVMISQESKEYLHVHPMVHKDELVLHADVKAKGIFRTWLQFLLEDRLYTFDFVLSMKELSLSGHHH